MKNLVSLSLLIIPGLYIGSTLQLGMAAPTTKPTPKPTIKPKATATPTISPSEYQAQYLKKALNLAKETAKTNAEVSFASSHYRQSCEIWAIVLRIGDGDKGVNDPENAKYNPAGPEMEKARKDLLNKLAILQKLGSMVSAITPVPSSFKDIDEKLGKYNQAAKPCIELMQWGFESGDLVKVQAGEENLNKVSRDLFDVCTALDQRAKAFADKKTYVPG